MIAPPACPAARRSLTAWLPNSRCSRLRVWASPSHSGGSGCETKEKFTSRWTDLQNSMFFLGNAFRLDSGKPPEKVRQVKEAKAFFAEVEKLRKAAAKGDQSEAVVHFVAAREALDIYLNEVELPPSGDQEYAREADETVPSLCQGSFCI